MKYLALLSILSLTLALLCTPAEGCHGARGRVRGKLCGVVNAVRPGVVFSK